MESLLKKITRLEERIIVLEEALGCGHNFSAELELSLTHGRILGMIYKRNLATNEMLCSVMSEYNNKDFSNCVLKTHIHNLRKVLKPFGISVSVIWGQGYYMTPDDKEKLSRFILK